MLLHQTYPPALLWLVRAMILTCKGGWEQRGGGGCFFVPGGVGGWGQRHAPGGGRQFENHGIFGRNFGVVQAMHPLKHQLDVCFVPP